MGMRVTSRNCWICDEPALDENGRASEPIDPSVALSRIAHSRCAPLAEFARRSVYQAAGEKLGPNRQPKLHVITDGVSTLLCKNDKSAMRRVGTVRDFNGVQGFSKRADACAVCARELAARVTYRLTRAARAVAPASA